MRVGVVIGRYGGEDGVALETAKWVRVLQELGHRCFILTGRIDERERDPDREDLLPILSFDSRECRYEQAAAFLAPADEQAELLERLDGHARRVERGILDWVRTRRIELLLPENASTLPFHLSMGMGILRAVERSGLPALVHSHDFAWERGDRYRSPHAGVNRIVESFPLRGPGVRHAVINSYQQAQLRERYGEDAVVVPNVMDFDAPMGRIDDGNRDLPRALGLLPDERPLFQVTRVVRRKGVETAIELVRRLDDARVRLVITGTAEDDPGGAYYRELVELARPLGDRILFAGDRFGARRGRVADGRQRYALTDAYAHAAACTYFSTYEGFGNAFVEAVAARVTVFVNNYRPVYWPDIGSLGFRTVQIEDGCLTDAAVEDVRRVLDDPKRRSEITEHNYELGRRCFSFDVLREKLEILLSTTG